MEKVKKLTDVIWNKEYLEPERKKIMENSKKYNESKGHFIKLEIGKLLRGLIH